MYKCRECGQLYFYEWYEWVDWDDGDNRHYTTLIPVQTEAEIEALKQESTPSLLRYSPRLQLDGGKIVWVGKGVIARSARLVGKPGLANSQAFARGADC